MEETWQEEGAIFPCSVAGAQPSSGSYHEPLFQHPDLAVHAASPTPSSCMQMTSPAPGCSTQWKWLAQWLVISPSIHVGTFYDEMFLVSYYLWITFPFSGIWEGRFFSRFYHHSDLSAIQWVAVPWISASGVEGRGEGWRRGSFVVTLASWWGWAGSGRLTKEWALLCSRSTQGGWWNSLP